MPKSATSLVVGTAITLVSVVYSAVRAGSATDAFSMERESDAYRPLREAERGGGGGGTDGDGEGSLPEGPVSYNYSFFHFIFALASMYTAMLMTGWGSADALSRDEIGVGWASVWVKMASSAMAAGIYTWSLVAPIVLADRDF